MVGCIDLTPPAITAAKFGFTTLSFQGQSLRFSRGSDSLIGYYNPSTGLLSLAGSTAPGPAAPDNLAAFLDSIPSDGSFVPGAVRPLKALAVTFYQTPGADSTLAASFHTDYSPGDQVTLETVDFTRCEIRGTFAATLFNKSATMSYPVTGIFWGRITWNAPAGPC